MEFLLPSVTELVESVTELVESVTELVESVTELVEVELIRKNNETIPAKIQRTFNKAHLSKLRSQKTLYTLR